MLSADAVVFVLCGVSVSPTKENKDIYKLHFSCNKDHLKAHNHLFLPNFKCVNLHYQ